MTITKHIQQMQHVLHGPSLVPATKSRRARLPFPASQLLDVYGYVFTYELARTAYSELSRRSVIASLTGVLREDLPIDLPDVQGYFRKEVAARKSS